MKLTKTQLKNIIKEEVISAYKRMIKENWFDRAENESIQELKERIEERFEEEGFTREELIKIHEEMMEEDVPLKEVNEDVWAIVAEEIDNANEEAERNYNSDGESHRYDFEPLDVTEEEIFDDIVGNY